ncbi:MFS transporter [Streptomyces sp. NBC_01754]|uniref:MFS transporter n=1 Tax=Streptomyces sp. NBC_01754 TaxID=2975930 RepID=UPI002DDA3C9B|nr:MFS transporter [Streptomyces sp. NBC_01754]WSC96478.1 MFS transporter [Streptomyces sp. NBC_01754]
MTESHAAPQKIAGAPQRGHGKGIALLVIASCQLMVVLDVTIVNIALPHMQRALGFSTENLSWVVNAYTLTFGGLLLLGGRLGDILGRRRVFVFGVLLFVFASLLGGLSQEPWQLLAARSLQGVGAAIASPTALSLITTTFHEGPERNRAFGVFAAVSAGGSAIGLLMGGVLVEWLDWRWVLFVNVPIGALIALATPRYIRESERHPGHFDLFGALTSTVGMVLLVYGFIRASEEGWSNLLTVLAFVGAVVFLAVFLSVERRSKQPITPLKMFRDRNRAGAYAMMLCLAAAMFGMFFFLTLFAQNVLDFSPLRTGLAFLPVSAVIAVSAGSASRLLPRWGPKPFMVTGAVLVAGGLAWLSRIDVHSSYAGSLLGPILVFGTGMGMQFVSLTLMAVSGVAPREAGAASGVLNATQQVGGSLGLSILVTVFGTASRNEATRQIHRFLSEATPAQKLEFRRTRQLPRPWGDQVLASGISTAFVVSVVFAIAAALVALFVVQVRASDLERLRGGAVMPAAEPATAGQGPGAPEADRPGGATAADGTGGPDQRGGEQPPGAAG